MEKIEGKGTKCPKCSSLYLGNQELCSECNIKTEPITYFIFKRINRERLVFIGLFSVLVAFVTFIITGELDTCGQSFLISLIGALSAFHTGNFLFGIGGGFKDTFIKEKELDESEIAFSWSKVLQDFFILLGIGVLVMIVVGLAKLIKCD